MAMDDCLDAHESGLSLVAYRKQLLPLLLYVLWITVFVAGVPFQESGPPICMAKLVMLRRKVRSKSRFI